MQIPELIVGISDISQTKIAIRYGADTVSFINYNPKTYLEDFSFENLRKECNFVKSFDKKFYLDLSNVVENDDIKILSDFIPKLSLLNIDGVILSSVGLIKAIKYLHPNVSIILSQRFGCLNWVDSLFWKEHKIKRIILPYQLSLEEIRHILANVDVELEGVVHGPVCIAYFGGCLLTNFLSYQGPILGECNTECRKSFILFQEKNKGELFQIFDDKNSTYIFNASEMCMIEHLPKLIEAGIFSFRINAEIKSTYYVAAVTRVYRSAIDTYFKSKTYEFEMRWKEELEMVPNRGYSTFFYFDKQDRLQTNYKLSKTKTSYYELVGIVEHYDRYKKIAVIELKNIIRKGDILQFISPNFTDFNQPIEIIKDNEKEVMYSLDVGQKILIGLENLVEPFDIVRREK